MNASCMLPKQQHVEAGGYMNINESYVMMKTAACNEPACMCAKQCWHWQQAGVATTRSAASPE
jgi:hypothetical protein